MKTFTADEVKAIVAKAEAAAHAAGSAALARAGRDFGACGFAWSSVYNVKGSTKLGKALVAAGFRKAYGGGLQFWMPGRQPCQSIDVHEVAADAFTKVIREELEVECYSGSRMD